MNRLRRYWSLWRTLPEEDRRERTGRLIERVFRQRPALRRLGVVPDQPRWGEFRRHLRCTPERLVAGLRAGGAERGPLYADLDPRVAALVRTHPAHCTSILAAAEALLDRRFDLLGSGPVRPLRRDGGIDWHLDFGSRTRWRADVHQLDLTVVRGDGSDVKLPWELARFQHLTVLGQAYRVAPNLLDRTGAARMRERCARELRAQIDDWIEHNPRGLGIHWSCPMEVALRAFGWLAAFALMRDAAELDDPFVLRLARSLWVHGRHVRRHLEIGAGGVTSNHYLADVIGLLALGVALPELREASAWYRFAAQAVEDEMERQVLPDGVDYERSLPYHRLVTEIFLHALLLLRAAGREPARPFRERLARMLEFTAACTRPDGTVPQWGDNDDGRLLPLDGYATHAPNDHRHLLPLGGSLLGRPDLAADGGGRTVEALWLADSPPPASGSAAPATSVGFPHAGVYVMRDADLHALVPCGPVGTGGLGNHTHNDLLSICVWAGGAEWIPDPGTGSYTGDPELRNALRSVAAHATLQVGAHEPNPFGAALDDLFAVEQRARPHVESWQADERGARLSARHSGFVAGAGVHRREVTFDAVSRRFTIVDVLAPDVDADAPARGPEPALLRFPLHPDVAAEPAGPDSRPADLDAWLDALDDDRDGERRRQALRLSRGGAVGLWIALDLPAEARVEIDPGLYSPRYGVAVPTRVVRIECPARPRLRTSCVLWAPATGVRR